jgi:hypothetical protein
VRLGWRVVWSGLGKKHPKNKKGERSAAQKGRLWCNVGLTQGQEPDEETHPILWTERPTGVLVGAGSLCPCGTNDDVCLVRWWEPFSWAGFRSSEELAVSAAMAMGFLVPSSSAPYGLSSPVVTNSGQSSWVPVQLGVRKSSRPFHLCCVQAHTQRTLGFVSSGFWSSGGWDPEQRKLAVAMVKNSAGEPEVLLFLSLPAFEMLDLSPPHCICPAKFIR